MNTDERWKFGDAEGELKNWEKTDKRNVEEEPVKKWKNMLAASDPLKSVSVIWTRPAENRFRIVEIWTSKST